MPLGALLGLAILAYFPHLKPAEARLYGRLIVQESRAAGVSPFDTAARIWVESGYRVRAVEPRAKNYGLAMIKRRDFDPRRNIRAGARALAYWQDWHRRGKCKQRPVHPYWLHYTWGYVVPPKRRTPRRWKMIRVKRLLKRKVDKCRNRRRRIPTTRSRLSI